MSYYKLALKFLCVLCVFYPGVFLYSAQNVERVADQTADDLILDEQTTDDLILDDESHIPPSSSDVFITPIAFVCLDATLNKRLEIKALVQEMQNKIGSEAEETGEFAMSESEKQKMNSLILDILLVQSVEQMQVSPSGSVLLRDHQGNPFFQFHQKIEVHSLNSDGLVGTDESCSAFFGEVLKNPLVQWMISYDVFDIFIQGTGMLGHLKLLRELKLFTDQMIFNLEN